MQTRTLIPLLTIAATGALVLACGSPDRIFVASDSGVTPPSDSSSGSDASLDRQGAADQQADGDGGLSLDVSASDTSTDTRADAALDNRVDATSDLSLDTTPPPDGTTTPDSSADTTIADTVAPDMGGPLDGAGMPDAYSDGLDCSSTPTPRITPAGSVGICPGKTVTLASSAATSYLWSNLATTASIDVGVAGSYTVTTTDARGCAATSMPTVVSVYPAPTAPTIIPGGPTRFCTGASVTLSTNSAASYSWSTGATSQSIVVIASGSYSVTTTDANGCGATSAPVVVTVVVPTSGTRAYTFTGLSENFVVPECITVLDIDAYGAQGGSSSSVVGAGGYGGQVTARLNVAPSSTLQFRVGGAGTLCSSDNTGGFNGGGTANCAGYNDGTNPIWYSGTGGGATDIRVSPYGLDDRVIVVGGGGGAGYNCTTTPIQDSGGVGGGPIGGKYPQTCSSYPDASGGGGTQASGGLGGVYPGQGNAGNGTYGLGGSGVGSGTTTALEGGGGGGGYYGGGGGCWEGGGGGSDYIRTTIASVNAQNPGVRAGHGTLILTW